MCAGVAMALAGTLRALSAHAPAVLALGVFVGLFASDLASSVRPLLPASIAGLLFLAMLRTDWPSLMVQMKRPLFVVCFALWLLIISPLLMWCVVHFLALPVGLAQALILMASVPPLFSSPALALMLGLDASLILVAVAATTLLSPFTLAAVASTLTGIDLHIEPLALMFRLSILILGCWILAVVVRAVAGKERVAQLGDVCDVAAVVLLLLFAIAVMDGVAERITQTPRYVAGFALAAFIAHIGLQLVTVTVCASLGLRGALSAGFAGGNRAMGLLLAVLPQSAPPDVLLYFALGQLPMYVMPALLAPLYARLLKPG